MRFTIDSKTAADTIGRVAALSGERPVLLTSTGTGLCAVGTSLTLEMEAVMQADIEAPGVMAVEGTALRGKVAATAKPVEVAAVPAAAPAAVERATSGRGRHFRSSSDAEACGRWIRGFVLGRAEDRAWYEKHVESRALSPNDNNKGGVFIPDSFASTVIRLVESFGAYPAQANNLQKSKLIFI